VRKYYPDEEQFKLLHRNGVYYYEYPNLERLTETSLPPKDAFYSRLNEDITDEDHKHTESAWQVFNCKTIRDCHDLYNVSDVLQLADNFRDFPQCMYEEL
jgi:hypothetical protein